MKKQYSQMLTLVLCLFLQVNCSSIPQTSVKERWNDSIKNYALVPIYPMVEQAYIGDLRLFTDNTNPYGLSSRYIGYVDEIEEELRKNEKLRPKYPNKKLAPDNAGEATVPPKPGEQHLGIAALPNITLVRITEAEIGGSGITGLWNWIVGGSGRSEAMLNLSVSGIETQEIDDIKAYALTKEHLEEQSNSPTFKEGVCAAATTLGDPTGMTSKIAVVTRVFYASGIKYVYGKSFGATLRAVAGEGSYQDLTQQRETMPPVYSANSLEMGVNNLTPPAVDLLALAKKTTPGLVGRFAKASRDTLTLEEVFERPIAFGADVLVFPISPLIDCSEIKVEVIKREDTTTLTAPKDAE